MSEFIFNYSAIHFLAAIIFLLGAFRTAFTVKFTPIIIGTAISSCLVLIIVSGVLNPEKEIQKSEFDQWFVQHDSRKFEIDEIHKKSGIEVLASHIDYDKRSIFTCYVNEETCERNLILRIPSYVSSFDEYEVWLKKHEAWMAIFPE